MLMKKLTLLLLTVVFTSCLPWDFLDKPDVTEPVSNYDPIIVSRTTLEKSIKIEESKDIIESSKIYVLGDFIFINDKHKGFHLFDNTDPKNPVKKKFLNVPGATDIAVRNNTFYINQATDLVTLTFNASDYSVKLEKRIRDVFPVMMSPDNFQHYDLKDNEVIIGWKEK